jgi:hypothetical protein
MRHFSRRTPPKAQTRKVSKIPNPKVKAELNKIRQVHPDAVKLLQDISPLSGSPLFDIKAEDLKRADFSKKLEVFRKHHPDSDFIVIVRSQKSPPSPLHVPDNQMLPHLKRKLRKLQTLRKKRSPKRSLNIDTIYEHIPYDRPLPPKGIRI